MNLSAKLVRNSFFQFWTTIVLAGSGLILSVVLARGLGPGEYGSYTFLIWLIGLGSLAANFGLDSMSTKFVSEYKGAGDEPGVRAVLQIAQRGRTLTVAIAALALIPISMVLIGDSQDPAVRFYPLLISLGLVPYALHNAFRGALQGFQRFDYCAYVSLVALSAKTLVAVVLVRLGYGILHLLVLEVFTWILVAVLERLLLHRLVGGPHPKVAPSLSGEQKRTIARFAAVSMALLLMDFVLNQRSEIFFLKLYRSGEEVGYYNLAFLLPAQSMALIPGVLGRVLMPAISEQFGRRDTARVAAIYHNSARYLMMLAFPLAAGGIVMAKPLVIALFGESYTDAVLPAQILFVASCVTAISAANTSVIYGTNHPLYFLTRGLLAVPAAIALAMILIPRYGVVGAALAHNVSSPFFLVTLWYTTTRLGLSWPYKDTIRIILACVVMAGGLMLLRTYLQAIELTPVIILLGAVLYLIQLPLLRILRKDDFALIARLWRHYRFVGWLGRSVRAFRTARV